MIGRGSARRTGRSVRAPARARRPPGGRAARAVATLSRLLRGRATLAIPASSVSSGTGSSEQIRLLETAAGAPHVEAAPASGQSTSPPSSVAPSSDPPQAGQRSRYAYRFSSNAMNRRSAPATRLTSVLRALSSGSPPTVSQSAAAASSDTSSCRAAAGVRMTPSASDALHLRRHPLDRVLDRELQRHRRRRAAVAAAAQAQRGPRPAVDVPPGRRPRRATRGTAARSPAPPAPGPRPAPGAGRGAAAGGRAARPRPGAPASTRATIRREALPVHVEEGLHQLRSPRARRPPPGGFRRVGYLVRPSEHRRVRLLEHLAVAEVHVHPARQARVEAAHRPHDVDAAEVVRAVLLEDRLPGDRVLVRAERAVGVRRAPVPGRRRVGVVVRDLAVADHQVVREHPAHRLVEAAADRLVRDLEVLEHLGDARPHLLQPLVDEVERHRRRVGDEVDPRPVALDRVRPLRDPPLELGLRRCPGSAAA